jgi:hypothetical protein
MLHCRPAAADLAVTFIQVSLCLQFMIIFIMLAQGLMLIMLLEAACRLLLRYFSLLFQPTCHAWCIVQNCICITSFSTPIILWQFVWCLAYVVLALSEPSCGVRSHVTHTNYHFRDNSSLQNKLSVLVLRCWIGENLANFGLVTKYLLSEMVFYHRYAKLFSPFRV